MIELEEAPNAAAPTLLACWISRGELATELGVSADTLGRWEARRFGPPCVRAGRKVLYRRSAVRDWLQAQELPPVKRAGGRK